MEIIPFPNKNSNTPQEKMSFEDFYNQFYSMAFLYAAQKLNNRADAEDLTSEVFMYCYEHYADYDPTKSSYKTWLFLILNSRLKNHYRDRKVHTDWSELENVLTMEGDDMERAIYLEQMRDQLVAAIRKLPEKQMKVVVWRYFQEKSFDYIAEQLQTTPGNVRVMLSRALNKLQEFCQEI